jgi:AcrR family transcriptional regulator
MSSDISGTRQKILAATVDLMEQNPGPGVRMADIARRAGISRQALYLHFKTRAELLRATTHHIDEANDTESRLAASRTATTGTERLAAFIEAWGNYMPNIQGIARALLAMQVTDEDARNVWHERMVDMREGCEAAIEALARDGQLHSEWTREAATDLLWTMLSFRNWDWLVTTCHWSQQEYVERLQRQARQTFVR